MHLFESTRLHIVDRLRLLQHDGVLREDVSFDAVTVEPPREKNHGDMATNAAMVLAKPAGKNPRELAQIIAERCESIPHLSQVSVAGPGFINLSFKPAMWQELVAYIVTEGVAYGESRQGAGRKVNVEYVSANPTGPMHIGHARGAVVGDVLARLLQKAGYKVTKEYYINDAGGQVDVLARSAYLRYREACGETVTIPEGYYPGEYLKIVGRSFREKYGADYLDAEEETWLPDMTAFALDAMMALIKNDLLMLGIAHDVFTSEKALHAKNAVDKAIAWLEEKGLVYTGVLEPPKGKVVDDYEAREQLLFRATAFGDEVDRPLKKSDGKPTYFAADIAYHHTKVERGFDRLINVLGADHGGYVKRLNAAVQALSHGNIGLEVVLIQLVKLMEGGEPSKMSKRAGNFVTLRDVLDAVGKDAMRFMMLTRKSDAPLEFDLKLAVEQSKDNPVFYVQYAHARICSVLRHAVSEMNLNVDEDAAVEQVEKLTDPAELQLIKKLAEWPRVVEQAAKSAEPHRIAFYLQELAAEFHGLWNVGKENTVLRFLVEDDRELTLARLALIKATANALASGLLVMGVDPATSM